MAEAELVLVFQQTFAGLVFSLALGLSGVFAFVIHAHIGGDIRRVVGSSSGHRLRAGSRVASGPGVPGLQVVLDTIKGSH